MTKTELIFSVANKAGVTKSTAEKTISAVFETISDGLQKGEKVAISGFGTFEQTLRSARSGRNPATGEPMEIAESKSVKFKPSKTLKDKVK